MAGSVGEQEYLVKLASLRAWVKVRKLAMSIAATTTRCIVACKGNRLVVIVQAKKMGVEQSAKIMVSESLPFVYDSCHSTYGLVRSFQCLTECRRVAGNLQRQVRPICLPHQCPLHCRVQLNIFTLHIRHASAVYFVRSTPHTALH